MEPREDKQQLRARGAAALDKLAVHQRLVGALQVLLQPGRRLEGDLERLLQDDRREGRVLLSGQPQTEALGGRERAQLLLELRHPVHDEVQVLEAEPRARLGRLAQQRERGRRLLPAHRELLVPAGHHARGVVLELLRRVGADGRDQQDGARRRRVLLEDVLQRRRERRERRDAERLRRERDQRRLQPVGAERLQQQDALEGRVVVRQARRELDLAPVGRRPLHPLRVGEGQLHQVGQRLRERREGGAAVGVRPRRHHRAAAAHAAAGAHQRERLAGEDGPLLVAEELRVEQVDQVHRVRQPVELEERARDGAEDELLQQRAERAHALVGRRVAELGRVERLVEELEEHGQRVLVHRVDAQQVEQ
eukprot:1672283-Prymnesium_polylepis.1